ncbi:glycoside hydrolase [Niastella koreensis]|uniref:Glycoside hydrolase family 2 sugar binding protein n=2 Tax=Niastella koreensis TaxID=354356 RepID=G8TE59_NIAKG|nr:glycoside hydrolase [Niastella koreensis]AEV97250.1 glycoside hydrolase family 2 sugar binding protein [Niastella koreensis GR20-10]OQP39075.1 glycoside hydrolase [Niastella koreensis]
MNKFVANRDVCWLFIQSYWLIIGEVRISSKPSLFELPAFPIETQCLIRKRIGDLREDQLDTWYEIIESTDEQQLLIDADNTGIMKKNLLLCYVMLIITLLLVAGTFIYLSLFSTTEEALRSDKQLTTLNGPWKFIAGDNMQYAASNYDDSQWENMDLTAPAGVHDDDVGLSGYLPGWTAKGHSNYSGYAWYRMKVPVNSLIGNDLALTGPPAVDDAYQLFVNGSLAGQAGDFAGTVPITYSIQPRIFMLPENVKKEKDLTIAFRVWMSAASLGAGAGGIHIAPTLGETEHIEKKYRFQWEQTIKGYIVEVVWPVLFILLAITMYWLNKDRIPPQSCKWFMAALILLGLMRLNQAVYAWFQIENSHLGDIVGPVILKPLVLGSWLMAWREWFNLHQPKWLPGMIALFAFLLMAVQLSGLPWVSPSIHTRFQTIADYLRLVLLALMLFIIYQGMRKQGMKDLLVLVAALVMLIALFPKEISYLHLIPGIWFPYGVGVTRGQFFYVAFVFVMYGVLIQKNSNRAFK